MFAFENIPFVQWIEQGFPNPKSFAKAINRMVQMPVNAPAALFLGTRISDPDANISTNGLGEPYAIAPNKSADGADNPFGRALNRRVSITVGKPAAPAPAS